MILNNQSSSAMQKYVRSKVGKTFDHEMGQVHKDNKGDHGALYFKPSL
jgi:hypothetical protein